MADASAKAMSPKRVLVMGLGAGGTAIVADALGDRLFVKDGRDTSANAEYYRGLVEVGGALLLGKVIYKWTPDLAVGVAIGGAGAGVARMAEKAEVAKSIRNLLDGTRDGTRNRPLPALPAAGATTTTTTTVGTPQQLSAGSAFSNGGFGVVTRERLNVR